MTVRSDVADAVNAAGIAKVTGHEWAPVVPLAGATWAQWAGATPSQYMGAVEAGPTDWDVLTALPAGDPQITGEALDAWLQPMLTALSPLGRLSSATPRQIVFGDGSTGPGLVIRLTVSTT